MSSSPRSQRRLVAALASLLAMSTLLAAQDPPEPAPKLDVVKLRNESVLEGVILGETETTLTIRIDAGQELELDKASIASVTRVLAGTETEAAARSPAFHARDAWFRVRDADGNLVGRMHLLVSARRDGATRLEQQWTFAQGPTLTRIHRIEDVDATMRPQSFLYRESLVSRADDKVLSERLAQGTVQGDRLLLKEAGKAGKSERSLPFAAGSSLPLLVEEVLRRGEARGARSFAAALYDPMEGSFELRRFDLADGVRSPALEGGRRAGARVVECTVGGRRQREWVATDGRILLIEINGVHLVAEPVSARAVPEPDSFGKVKLPPLHRRFADLEVWLPRATWTFGAEPSRGKILDLVSGYEDSKVQLWHLDAGAREAPLQAAADEFLRRWRLDETWFEELGQTQVQVGQRTAVRVDGGGKDAAGRLRVGRAYVVETNDGFLALVAHSPGTVWEALRLEIDEVILGLREPRPETASAAPAK